jgi:hypothetical protein
MGYNRFASWQIKPAPATNLSITGAAQGNATIPSGGSGEVPVALTQVLTTPGQYGSATSVPVVTVNAAGQITSITEEDALHPPGGINQLTGDVTAGPGSGSVAATLATVNTNVGTFGDGTHVARITVNGKGLITAASSVAITFPSYTTTYFGSGAPSTLHNDGDLYFNRSTSPYTGYVQDAGAWKQIA